jgi:hypothetical protein
MVTSGAAPLIVSAFRRVRRSTSTNAFQTRAAGRAGAHRPSEAVHRPSPVDLLTRIKQERVPTGTVARKRVPDMRGICSAGGASASRAEPDARAARFYFFPIAY